MTSTEDRLTHMLWLSMRDDIVRYLIFNTEGMLDGAKKADTHSLLCETYIASILLTHPKDIREHDDGMGMFDFVHTVTQDLTSFLDEEIGFPLEDPDPDYIKYVTKFFNKFIEYADEGIRRFYGWKDISSTTGR